MRRLDETAMVANASPHLVCYHHAHRLFDIDILTTLRDHTMRDEDGTHRTSVAKDKRKRLTVLNALCLDATGLQPEINADAKKKIPPSTTTPLVPLQRCSAISSSAKRPDEERWCTWKHRRSCHAVTGPERRPCYHVLEALAL